MKAKIKKGDLIVFQSLGRKKRIPLIDIDTAEYIENHKTASLVVNMLSGDQTKLSKMEISFAKSIHESLLDVIDPKESYSDGPLAFEDIKNRLSKMSERTSLRTSKLSSFIFEQALHHQASDIHLEGGEKGASISYRVDGIIHGAGTISPDLAERLFTYLKVESGVTSYRSDIPQEGAMRISGNKVEKDLRLSFIPIREHEKVVARIFGIGQDKMGFTDLGFSEQVNDKLCRTLNKRAGMLLLTGPSASGKTTTLYSCLKKLIKGPESSLHAVSIEDPVECTLEGVTQVEVDHRRDMTFEKLLGNILRQDAEVIMVGEIRSTETAKIAVQAALTGHLILSTIHAGRAPEVLVRLLDLGIEPYQAASSVSAAMSQRLIRKVCGNCKEEHKPEEKLINEFNEWFPEKLNFVHGAGCDECYGTGYRGRTSISEIVSIDNSWQDLIRGRPSSGEALSFAVEKGMTQIFQDGIEKAAKGVTTLEEIKRVLG
jgi:type II secretory ATPase GspE/PulE/Tfp pilus assembly ATPase PilB-like protein